MDLWRFLVKSLHLAVLLSVTTGLGCGKASSGSASEPRDEASDVDAGAEASAGLKASNGVSIPEPNLQDTCASLGIETAPCASAPCKPLSCGCGVDFDVAFTSCMGESCLAGVSCPAACALGTNKATTRAFLCVYAGVCKTDQDCKPKTKCLLTPGYATGECQSGGEGSDCFGDADCLASACVALADGTRTCTGGKPGSPCNRDNQCLDRHCILKADSFAGMCTNGANGNPCLLDADCRQILGRCVGGTCSNGVKGALCATRDDCYGNFCVGSKCDTGEDGAKCADASDCVVPFCIDGTCSSGAVGHACRRAAECVSQMCDGDEGFPGVCTDGKAGSPCRAAPQSVPLCQAGLYCVPKGNMGVCAPIEMVGTKCSVDSDCQTQKCGGLPDSPESLCTEGKLNQRCRESQQCQAGLHCAISNGFAGLCVAGVGGDPCTRPEDCASGVCRPPASLLPDPSVCSFMPDLAPCGQGAVCVATLCMTQTCAPGDAGVTP